MKKRKKETKVDWEEIISSCNREGLLPEKKFHLLPQEVVQKAPYNEIIRRGRCYSTPDGLYYDPSTGEFIHIYTEED